MMETEMDLMMGSPMDLHLDLVMAELKGYCLVILLVILLDP